MVSISIINGWYDPKIKYNWKNSIYVACNKLGVLQKNTFPWNIYISYSTFWILKSIKSHPIVLRYSLNMYFKESTTQMIQWFKLIIRKSRHVLTVLLSIVTEKISITTSEKFYFSPHYKINSFGELVDFTLLFIVNPLF